MSQKELALHESLEIHELLNFKTICMSTSKIAQGVVFDQDLKTLLQKDVQQSIQSVKTLEVLLSKSSKN